MIVWLKQDAKPDFDRCEAEATRLLFNQSTIDTLNIDVRSLEYDKNIYFDSIQNYCTTVGIDINDFCIDGFLNDGCTIAFGDIYLILYNEDINNPERLNWTLAHEVGHIYMNHTQDGEKEEIEAHWFAAQLLMPEYAIRYMEQKLGSVCQLDLLLCFNVSRDAASYRLKSLSRKYHREPKQQEKLVLYRFKQYLDDTCSTLKNLYSALGIP